MSTITKMKTALCGHGGGSNVKFLFDKKANMFKNFLFHYHTKMDVVNGLDTTII